MAGFTVEQASVIRFRSSCNVDGGVAYIRCFMHPHRKKSNGFRSDERGGHSTQPPYAMTCCWNVFRMYYWTFYRGPLVLLSRTLTLCHDKGCSGV
ncbi:hypothetical protein AVEN_122049-1 [Araneus ventricosus]|uniref:Uncharacterized protein n=1 Tax=Araneus ventricosus TaxID=182803 RepID=A0A4Y2F3L2_ARAVE|nr:hypothetical protein AVEN_122049-1 [Araneus ventricosus]